MPWSSSMVKEVASRSLVSRHESLLVGPDLYIDSINPKPTWRPDPYISPHITFHAVGHTPLVRIDDSRRENPHVDQVALDNVEHPDIRLLGVVHIKKPFVRRKTQSVGLRE